MTARWYCSDWWMLFCQSWSLPKKYLSSCKTYVPNQVVCNPAFAHVTSLSAGSLTEINAFSSKSYQRRSSFLRQQLIGFLELQVRKACSFNVQCLQLQLPNQQKPTYTADSATSNQSEENQID